MKKLILQKSIWRCGGDYINSLGKGETLMLNEYGFMCCLGQFGPQVDERVTKSIMLNMGTPANLKFENIFTKRASEFEESDYKPIYNSDLSRSAIHINDDESTTPDQKIEDLKKLFSEHGFEIEVIE